MNHRRVKRFHFDECNSIKNTSEIKKYFSGNNATKNQRTHKDHCCSTIYSSLSSSRSSSSSSSPLKTVVKPDSVFTGNHLIVFGILFTLFWCNLAAVSAHNRNTNNSGESF